MANAIAVQVLQDGPKNTVVKVTGILDTANATLTTLLDPALQSSIIPDWPGQPLPLSYAIKAVDYNVQTPLIARLWWDATTDVLIDVYTWRYSVDYTPYGMLQNNSGAGKTGKILIDTLGYTSGTLEFSLVLWAVKQGPFG